MIYTLTLNPALDYVLNVNNLRFDDINRATDSEIFFGGKGINVSAVLNELGIESTALGFVGGFSGEKLCELLCKSSIKNDFVKINGDTRINVKIKADTEVDINANGPEISSDEVDKLFEKMQKICDGDFLVLSGSIPKNIDENIYEKIIKKLAEKNIKFVVDTADKTLLNLLKYKPFLIKPNHHELGDIFGVNAESDEETISLAQKLRSMGAQNVLVSRAEKGAILIDENGRVHKIGIAKGKLVNSVGCGDSMVAGFIAGYLENADYSYALKLATACGCATAFSKRLAVNSEIFETLSHI